MRELGRVRQRGDGRPGGATDSPRVRRLAVAVAALAAILLTGGALVGSVVDAHADDDDRGGRETFDDDRRESRDLDGGAGAWGEASPDPGGGAGMPIEFERDEIVASGLRPGDIERLKARGFFALQRRRLEALDVEEVRFRVPRAYSVASAAQLVRDTASGATVDANHLYRPAAAPCTGRACTARQLVAWTPLVDPCEADITIGLIDTAVAIDHPTLRGSRIETHVARGAERKPGGKGHGTAVASVLVGKAAGDVVGLLPSARLVAVDAFHAGSGGDRMDAFDLLAAIDHLLGLRVPVINLSFAGPANTLVEQAVQAAERRGAVLIAAVGNAGPRAAPRYPAAYPSVIGVTAIDEMLRVYRWAGQGTHVTIAAPGVDIPVANAGGWLARKTTTQSGTSMAAPFVTASVARLLGAHPQLGPPEVRRQLSGRTRDLGDPGPDAIFGHGLLQAVAHCRGPVVPLLR
jgi:hypothetical protein